jgi:hypothetical protein
VQSGATGYVDKSDSYAILLVETVALADNNLPRRMQSGFTGYPDKSGSYVV